MNRSVFALATLAIASLMNAPAIAGENAAAEPAKGAVVAEAAKAAAPAAEHRVYAQGEIQYGDPPPGLPKGAKVAVLQGDPSAAGVFTMRVMLPAGYRIPPHHHPADENITVLVGELYMGVGETFDEGKAHSLGAGAFGTMPMGMRHYAFTKAETVFQLHGMGPWGIIYVNPEDDPRSGKQASK
jgi:quercetin dioxygenase-like cupin family protein